MLDKSSISRCIPTLSGALKLEETRDFSLAFPFPSWFLDDEAERQAPDGVGVKPLENWSLEVQLFIQLTKYREKILTAVNGSSLFSDRGDFSTLAASRLRVLTAAFGFWRVV